jgi:hypothetical protein
VTLPFTAAQFYGVFRAYNTAVWPLQGVLVAMAGLLLIGFALVVYPVGSAEAGHVLTASPTFGLTRPTPTFTVGLLGVWPDLGFIAAGVVGPALLVPKPKSKPKPGARPAQARTPG